MRHDNVGGIAVCARHLRSFNSPVSTPSLESRGVHHFENCARNQHWRGFQRIVTAGLRRAVTMRVGADYWRTNLRKTGAAIRLVGAGVSLPSHRLTECIAFSINDSRLSNDQLGQVPSVPVLSAVTLLALANEVLLPQCCLVRQLDGLQCWKRWNAGFIVV